MTKPKSETSPPVAPRRGGCYVHTMKTLKRLALAMTVLTLGACAQATAPFAVSKIGPDSMGLSAVTVTATVDSVTINSIKANRGNCKDELGFAAKYNQALQAQRPLPGTLKFGEAQTRIFACRIIEAELTTPQGAWTFNW